MRVQCIERPPQATETNQPPIVQVGKVYTVIDSENEQDTRFVNMKAWYELAEDIGMCYAQSLFIPVSDIDEREFVRDYNKETV